MREERFKMERPGLVEEGQEVVIVIGEELNEERIQQYF